MYKYIHTYVKLIRLNLNEQSTQGRLPGNKRLRHKVLAVWTPPVTTTTLWSSGWSQINRTHIGAQAPLTP